MVGKICSRPVVMVRPDSSVEEAAHLMRARNVGAVVVVEAGRPVGLVTDRDIAVGVVATRKDAAATRIAEVMTKELTVIKEDAGVLEAAKIFGMTAVRRLPVVSREGELIGIISLDDLLILLGTEMGQIAAGLARELGRATP
ncbi:MAG TPA: CBS domain-containing protein [Methylomirabilota bacterium]|nr:CBS domain-containing protein [Methylomirabilota bacterium]